MDEIDADFTKAIFGILLGMAGALATGGVVAFFAQKAGPDWFMPGLLLCLAASIVGGLATATLAWWVVGRCVDEKQDR